VDHYNEFEEVESVGEIFGRIGGPRDDIAPAKDARSDWLPDARGARWLRRHLAGGVVAVTTVVHNTFRAATATACTIVSLEPLQILVSIELDSQMDGWLDTSRLFGLSVLDWQQQVLADRFAGFAPLAHGRFEGIDYFTAVTGAPLLAACIAWADCEITADLVTGDHRCYIGTAAAIGQASGDEHDPLVYYLNRYRRVH
jgi:flavin reductase (DIM6/NTAB) family NADH-FMN oxidoreductase RutF